MSPPARSSEPIAPGMAPSVRRQPPFRLAAGILVGAAFVALGLLSGPGFQSVAPLMVSLSVYAMAYGVLLGYANQPSLGQSLFFGLGSYALILPFSRSAVGFWSAMGLAFALGLVGGAVVGALVVRMTEAYHVIVTALFAATAELVANNLTSITGGTGGLSAEIPTIPLGPWRVSVYDSTDQYLILLGFGIITFAVLGLLVRSPIGKIWQSIRENESRAQSIGYNTFFYKLVAYTICSGFTAVGGALYAIVLRYTNSGTFGLTWSVLPFLWVIIGGSGTLLGPVIGVALFTIFQFYVSQVWTSYPILFGLLMLVLLRWAPEGIVGYGRELVSKYAMLWAQGSLLRLPRLARGTEARGPTGPEGPHLVFPGRAGELNSAAPNPRSTASMAIRQADPNSTPELEVEGITVRFDGLTALQDVRMTLRSGEVHAVLGPNGAGKTTLFNVIAGNIKPSRGRVLFRGREITGLRPNRIHRLGIARAFQTPSIFPSLTVAENIWLSTPDGQRVRWHPIGDAMQRARASEGVRHAANLVGLDKMLRQRAGYLSHADQKLLDIAMAYASKPSVLLLDEPTQGVSPDEVDRITAVIGERLRGVSILMIEHNVRTVFAVATAVTVLDHGHVIAEGTPEEIAENEDVQMAYLGQRGIDMWTER